MFFSELLRQMSGSSYESATAYRRHFRNKLRVHRDDRALAFANAIGSESISLFVQQGDGQVAVLKHHGLRDGMSVYDLGCGCGRTAQALQRAGWSGRYLGTDIVKDFVFELRRRCPGFEARVHRRPTIIAGDSELDVVFHWSVFTHISTEECFLYLEDIFRALKPGGKLIFSFLEFGDLNHWRVFESRLSRLRRHKRLALLDTFLHRDWIRLWAERIGFDEPEFTDGQDGSKHPPMWQTVVAMLKPLEHSSGDSPVRLQPVPPQR